MSRGIRYIIAAALIAFGAVLVLENIGIIEFEWNSSTAWGFIYPSLFVLFGIKWMVERFRHRGGSWTWGSFFFIFGSLLLMDRFDLIYFKFTDVFKLWPLLIIYIGFAVIGSSGKPKVIIQKNDEYFENDDSESGSFFTVGSHEYNKPNWKVEPTTIKTLAGDFYYDFSKGYIPEKEIPISISALAGDVHLIVPENVDFKVKASVKAGDIDIVGNTIDGINRSLNYETPNYNSAKRKLNFTLKLKAGSIRVDYV